jgi:hypothetical protein
MHDAVVLGMVIFRISPVDDERHPIDPLPSSTNASATQPEPATGTMSFSLFWSQDIQRTLSTRRTACDVRPQKRRTRPVSFSATFPISYLK